MTSASAHHIPDPAFPRNMELALFYASHGVRVAPITPGRKYPPMEEWQKAATTDPEIITAWYTGLYRDHGVCIATGPESGVWVLDADKMKLIAGEWVAKKGLESLAALEAHLGPLPPTVEAVSGTGGRHLLFAWDDEHPVRNSQSNKLGITLPDGTAIKGQDIDVRGDGGQIVAEPSIHPDNGQPYLFVTGHRFGDLEVATFPDNWWEIFPDGAFAEPADYEPRTPRGPEDDEDSPAAWFNDSTTWDQLLRADGWTLSKGGNNPKWTRPGKDPRQGISASENYQGRGTLWVGTSSIRELTPEKSYTRFGYVAAMHFGGDGDAARSAFARHIRTRLMPKPEDKLSDDEFFNVAAGNPGKHYPNLDPEAPWKPPIDEAGWHEPDPLTVPLGHGSAFPVDSLPAFAADLAASKAHSLQAPVDTLAMNFLGALATVTLDKVDVLVDPDDDWVEDVNQYLVSVLPSGMSKSPSFKAMLNVLYKLQAELRGTAKEKIRAAQIEKEVKEEAAEKRKKDVIKLGEQGPGGPAGFPAALLEVNQFFKEADDVKIPYDPRLLISDVTMETLTDRLAQHGGRLALVSTEGGPFKILGGQYNDKGANLDIWLCAHSGDPYTRDRSGIEIELERVLMSACLATQPLRIEQIGRNPELRGTGLTARFMYSIPETNIGKRDRRPARLRNLNRAKTQALQEAYDTRLLAIGLRLQDPDVDKVHLALSTPAHDLYSAWDQSIEERIGHGGDLSHMVDWIMKLRACVVRLAGSLHIAEYAELNPPTLDADGHPETYSALDRLPAEIAHDTMVRALQIGHYWINHALQVYEVWSTTEGGLTYAKEIIEWAIGFDGKTGRFTGSPKREFTVTQAHKECIRQTARNEKIEPVIQAIEVLANLGWVHTGSDFPGKRGGASPVIRVHPAAPKHWAEGFMKTGSSEKSENQSPSGEKSENPEEIQGGVLQVRRDDNDVLVRRVRSENKPFIESSLSKSPDYRQERLEGSTEFPGSPVLTSHSSHQKSVASLNDLEEAAQAHPDHQPQTVTDDSTEEDQWF